MTESQRPAPPPGGPQSSPQPPPPQQPPPSPQPPPPRGVDDIAGVSEFDPTTVLRCAAWQDVDFRRRVLAERQDHAYRALSREPGLDPRAVVAECARARRAASVAGAALASLWVPLLFVHLVVALLVLAAFALVTLTAFQQGTGQPGFRGTALQGKAMSVAAGAVLLMCVVVAGYVAYMAAAPPEPDPWTTPESDPYAPGAADPDAPAVFRIMPWPAALACYAVGAFVIALWYHQRRGAAVEDILRQDGGERASASGVGTVPVGFFSRFNPFIGTGVRYQEWPLTLDLRPARAPGDTGEPGDTHGGEAGGAHGTPSRSGPALVEALYEGLRTDLRRLGAEDGGRATPRPVDVADCVFLTGRRTHTPETVRDALVDPATGALRPEWVAEFIRGSHERARHFLEAGVSMWDGQIVVTAFVRLSVHGGSLRVEGETFVMPPIDPRHMAAVDAGTESGGRRALTALRRLLPDLGGFVTELVSHNLTRWRAERFAADYRRHLREGRTYIDFAPRLSIREAAAGTDYRQLFQLHDVRRVSGAITKRCLTSLSRALKREGYDTSDLDGIVQNINLGLQQFGGTATFSGPVSVGPRSTATQSLADSPKRP
ncbi:hypothetical protein HNR12_001519 [Streptomonospora nanhaiensis]|uniref:Uncharacterized protein n=1 Tax=Streptomonospora nanhaiensis TaxID=1323731 RepID=A0A853BL44_9ACTN|nr:hypothetical protein [Streptomonospora nanhaiensis]NYI95242.1 hypothetical protein [Streptomonospora nanhaiensis]